MAADPFEERDPTWRPWHPVLSRKRREVQKQFFFHLYACVRIKHTYHKLWLTTCCWFLFFSANCFVLKHSECYFLFSRFVCMCVFIGLPLYTSAFFFAHFSSIFVGYFYVWIILFSLSECKCVYFYFVFRLLFTTYYLPILYLLSTLSPLICFALFCVSCDFSFLLSQCGCL